MKSRILSSYPAPEECFAPFRGELDITAPDHPLTHDEVVDLIPDYEGFFAVDFPTDRAVIEAGKKLRVVANRGVGYDSIDTARCTELGIAVINTPNSVTESTAEQTCALIISAMRGTVHYDRDLRRGIWPADSYPKTNTPIFGSTLGILGFGRIGKAVSRRMQGMGMHVIYHNRRRLDQETEKALGVRYVTFEEMLAEADCIALNLPYTPESYHLFNEETIAKMKKTAYLINAARGPLVDEIALYKALKNGVIKGAGLDVFEHEPHPYEGLFELNNVVLTPHAGTSLYECRVLMTQEALHGIAAYLRGEHPYNLVNSEILSV